MRLISAKEMEMADDADPVRQRLKVVHVMDCVPGRTSLGQPITILTLGHNGEIEEPMMLDIPDTKRLVVDLLVSLREHGNDLAGDLIRTHFTGADEDEGNRRRRIGEAPGLRAPIPRAPAP